MSKDLVERIINNSQAEQITKPNSYQVSDLLGEERDGMIKVFGEKGSSSQDSARRIEITTDKGVVSVHKDIGQDKGIFSLASRFSGIDVKKGEKIYHLDIKIDQRSSSGFNPSYIFEDPNNGDPKTIGYGWGQGVHTVIAGKLLGFIEGAGTASVSHEVHDWIDSKLQD